MSKTFSENEQFIRNLFVEGTEIVIDDTQYRIQKVGKPSISSGEPKTDIYIKVVSESDEREYKISYKQHNADFLENKISAERAEQILGKDWESIIIQSTMEISKLFEERTLIYKQKENRTEKGSITLGWKFELLNKQSGRLSSKLVLDDKQLKDIYSGENLSNEKKNAIVEGSVISESGVANYILVGDSFNSAEEVLLKLISIDDYINDNNEIYFACKALNYRTFVNKYDGDRPLAVYVDWSINDQNQLKGELVFSNPLNVNGNEVSKKLLKALNKINVNNTDDLNNVNVDNDTNMNG